MTTAKRRAPGSKDPFSRKNTRPTGAKLNRVDSTLLLEAVRRSNRDNTNFHFQTLRVINPLGVFISTQGGIVVLDTEGTGGLQQGPNVTVILSHMLDYMPFYLPYEEFMKCVKDTKIDLSDHIRVFGDRLEGNFQNVYSMYKSSVK